MRTIMLFFVLTSLLILGLAQAQYPFNKGSEVIVTSVDGVNVRVQPGGKKIGAQALNSLGTVINTSPILKEGFWWWEIDFAEGADGWIAQGTGTEPYVWLAPEKNQAEEQSTSGSTESTSTTDIGPSFDDIDTSMIPDYHGVFGFRNGEFVDITNISRANSGYFSYNHQYAGVQVTPFDSNVFIVKLRNTEAYIEYIGLSFIGKAYTNNVKTLNRWVITQDLGDSVRTKRLDGETLVVEINTTDNSRLSGIVIDEELYIAAQPSLSQNIDCFDLYVSALLTSTTEECDSTTTDFLKNIALLTSNDTSAAAESALIDMIIGSYFFHISTLVFNKDFTAKWYVEDEIRDYTWKLEGSLLHLIESDVTTMIFSIDGQYNLLDIENGGYVSENLWVRKQPLEYAGEYTSEDGSLTVTLTTSGEVYVEDLDVGYWSFYQYKSYEYNGKNGYLYIDLDNLDNILHEHFKTKSNQENYRCEPDPDIKWCDYIIDTNSPEDFKF